MTHNTPLKYHFKDAHTWGDLCLLALLFILAYYFPVMRIIPLVASLELLGFLSFHLVARHNSLKLQGFFGGFISSTAVFVQMLNDPTFSRLTEQQLKPALLLSCIAMLLECIVILAFFSHQIEPGYYLPFFAQGSFILAALLFSRMQPDTPPANADLVEPGLEIDHPIVWKNVARLSLLVFTIVTVMNILGNNMGFSREISILLMSFFEAHAVLAATMTEWSLSPDNTGLLLPILIILFGNTCSKCYLLITGKNLHPKKPFIILLLASYVFTLVVSVLFNHITFLP